MTKTLIVAALLSSFAALSFAQAPADAASAPAAAVKHVKHKHKHVKHAKHAASAAVNPEASVDKKGGN